MHSIRVTPVALTIAVLTLAGCSYGPGPKETVGTVVGAASGGLAGAQFGKGCGKLVTTAIGTLLGTLAGSDIGRSLDRADRMAAERTTQRSLDSTPAGATTTWRNPDSGNGGGGGERDPPGDHIDAMTARIAASSPRSSGSAAGLNRLTAPPAGSPTAPGESFPSSRKDAGSGSASFPVPPARKGRVTRNHHTVRSRCPQYWGRRQRAGDCSGWTRSFSVCRDRSAGRRWSGRLRPWRRHRPDRSS